jgi:hypothetical protein
MKTTLLTVEGWAVAPRNLDPTRELSVANCTLPDYNGAANVKPEDLSHELPRKTFCSPENHGFFPQTPFSILNVLRSKKIEKDRKDRKDRKRCNKSNDAISSYYLIVNYLKIETCLKT